MNTTPSKPRFRKVGVDTYEVRLDNVLAGIVYARYYTDSGPLWWSRYNDGSRGPTADRRIDVAWALINS